ncbi:MAG TPA: PEP-utilizing enzyme [Acidimicrobiales bacterium]
MADETITFTPPGPGQWEAETSHHGVRPLSPYLRDTYVTAGERGATTLLGKWGLPIAEMKVAMVHGCMYMRPIGVGEKADAEPKGLPPAFVLKLVSRLHPELRRRNKLAAKAFAEKSWRPEVDRWFERDRAEVTRRNLELQSVDLATLDDEQLLSHLAEALAHFDAQIERNMATHGGDLIPVGDLLAHCEHWGISVNEAAAVLVGSSPAAVETAVLLAPVGRALATADGVPTSVEEVRALGPEAAAAVDEWQTLHAWRLVTSDDVDRPTLAERPDLQLAALLHAKPQPPVDDATAVIEATRARVPESDRALFDELVVEARYGNRQRDDIRAICWNWAGGLVRRALLECGRRLVAKGLLHDVEQVVELFPGEVAELVRTGSGPSADEIAERAQLRDRIEAMPPPRTLGPVAGDPPPFDVFPKPLARMSAAMMILLSSDGTVAQTEALRGTGIGAAPYRGRARIAVDAMEAMERIEPGDVLVAPLTGPSLNSLLPLVGALVVEEGGPICHAAIVAREFGIPAIIGAVQATSVIPDGAMVEVDPVAGVVRVL